MKLFTLQKLSSAALLCLSLLLFCTHSSADEFRAQGKGQGVRLLIVRGLDITNQNTPVFAGERISLFARASALDATIENPSWKVSADGMPVRDWQYSDTESKPLELTDTTSTKIEFYWVKPGKKLEVTLDALVNGTQMSVSAYFEVKKPKSSVQVVRGPIVAKLLPANTPQVPGDDDPYMSGKMVSYGDLTYPTRTAGITFTASYPEGDYGGETQWVQIIKTSVGKRGQTGTPKNLYDVPGLDLSYPYSRGLSTNDTPNTSGLPLTLSRYERSDTFTMYLMWKAPGYSSFAIPLQRIDWEWRAVAANDQNGKWVLSTPPNAPDPIIKETDDPPKWVRNANPPRN